MVLYSSEPIKVSMADISTDEIFKVSKHNYQNTLPASLKISGMLEVPYIFKSGSGYGVLTCHNRIKILRESGVAELFCFVMDSPDADIFMNHISLKAYRNEIGSFGKLKTLFILNTFFNLTESVRKDFCTKILKLPLEIIENGEYLKKVLDFPETMIGYIDEKDISFKVIKDLSILPHDWIAVIDKWIKNVPVRVNIFRMLIDNIFDIYRRGDAISSIDSISLNDDKALHDAIYRIRYPEFSKLKMQTDKLVGELTGSGLSIDFPEYFDRGFVTLKIDINKKSDCVDQLGKLSKIKIEKLRELLSFL